MLLKCVVISLELDLPATQCQAIIWTNDDFWSITPEEQTLMKKIEIR